MVITETWQAAPAVDWDHLAPDTATLLQTTASLTAHWSAVDPNFSFQCHCNETQILSAADAAYLSMQADDSIWVREISFQNTSHLFEWARTLIPMQTLQVLVDDGLAPSQPIGHILFAPDAPTARSAFEYLHVTPDSHYHQQISEVADLSGQQVWGRRSRFLYDAHPLAVFEFFVVPFGH